VLRTTAQALLESGKAEGLGLANGSSGLALTHALLERVLPGRGHGERAAALIDATLAECLRTTMAPGLFSGVAGVVWLLQLLEKQGLVDLPSGFLTPFDRQLEEMVRSRALDGHLDLVSGLSGLAIYARERGEAGGALLEAVAAAFARTVIQTSRGPTWPAAPDMEADPTDPDRRPGVTAYNLGLAHGSPGVILALSLCCEDAGARPTARPLLQEAVRFLLGWRAQEQSSGFARMAYVDGATSGRTRPAWCYGDPGVALALDAAARALVDRPLALVARDLFERAARRTQVDAGIGDASICHGTAGALLWFTIARRRFGGTAFDPAIDQWGAATVDQHRPALAPTGFVRVLLEPDGSPRSSPCDGILYGSAGVALALATALGQLPPAWCRFLGVFVPWATGRRPAT
jgi:lantibiotic biosynthesis protein